MRRGVFLGGFWKQCFLTGDSPGKKRSPAPQSFVMAGCMSWQCLSLRTKPKGGPEKGSGGGGDCKCYGFFPLTSETCEAGTHCLTCPALEMGSVTHTERCTAVCTCPEGGVSPCMWVAFPGRFFLSSLGEQ